MKALKIILAILLFIAILPCMIISGDYSNSVGDFAESIYNYWPSGVAWGNVYTTMKSVETAMGWLTFLILVFFVTAGVLALAWRKKHFVGFIAGGLPLLTVIWYTVCNLTMRGIGNHEVVELVISIAQISRKVIYMGNLRGYILLVSISILGFLSIAIAETISHNRKKKAGILTMDKAEPTETSATPSEASLSGNQNIDEIKKYKQLLDEGIITQEEFDTKKKQLLNL